MSKDSYASQSQSSSWTSWGIGLVKSSGAWAWNKVVSSLTEVEKGDIQYVVPAVLEVYTPHNSFYRIDFSLKNVSLKYFQDKCSQVMQLPEASSEEVVDLEELMELYPDLFPDDYETQIILDQLRRTGKVIIDGSSSQTMLKFLNVSASPKKSKSASAMLNSSLSVRSTPPVQRTKEKAAASTEITEVDKSLAALKRTEKLLDSEISELEDQMNALKLTAKARLNEGSREAVI